MKKHSIFLMLLLITYCDRFLYGEFENTFTFVKSFELKNTFEIVDLAIDKENNIFVLDFAGENIKKYSPKGELLQVIGGKVLDLVSLLPRDV